MPIHNSDIARAFDEVADLLEIKGANPFRVRAYRNAARVVGNWPQSLAEVLNQDKHLPRLPGVGEDLGSKIKTLVKTGRLPVLEQAQKGVPRGLLTLLKIPMLGPKRVATLQKGLGIRSIQDLRKAVRSGKIRALPGFGTKIEEKLLQETSRQISEARRIQLSTATEIAAVLPGASRATTLPCSE